MTGAASEGTRSGSRLPRRLRIALTWLVAGGILAYLLATIPLDSLVGALARVSATKLVVLTLVYQSALLATDSFALWVALRHVLHGAHLHLRQVALVRAATYLLAIRNYGVGQGGIVYFLRASYAVPLSVGTAAILLTSAGFALVLSAVLGAGFVSGALPAHPGIRAAATLLLVAVPTYLVLVAVRPGFLRRVPPIRPLLDAGVAGSLWAAGARALHTAALLGGHWLAMRLFSIDDPLGDALARLPVMLMVLALPISPSGLGTTQAAAVVLFSGYAPGTGSEREAAVLAYSLSFHVLSQGLTALLSLPALRLLPSAPRPGNPAD